ncbi:MAG TPA: VWA domain-containing protein [Candidatus Limnocylindrales bacterium]|nr:VWA domain-containing protein [Candidatus Limnocylindrales bacterium]
MKSIVRGLVVLFYLLICLASSIHSQSDSKQPAGKNSKEQLPTLKVATRLVVVDVVATDHKGNAIPDLKPDDFTVLEENRQQNIKVFAFADASKMAADDPPPMALPLNRYTNVPRFRPHGPVTVILLDGINTHSMNQGYVKEEMLKLLPKLPSGQPVAVYALGLKLRLLQDFTTDPALLRAAIDKKGASLKPLGDPSDSVTRDLGPAVMENMPDLMRQQVLAFERESVANQMDLRVELTLSQLRALARNLAGVAGRKNLVWLSESFPAYLYTVAAAANGNFSGPGTVNSASRPYYDTIEKTSDLLANAQVAVYPVDARGISNDDPYAQLSNSDGQGNYLGRSSMGMVSGARGSGTMTELGVSSDARMSSHTTMNDVADLTGGKAFYNTNNLTDAVRQGIQDGSAYYTLGYYPDNKDWNGRFRKITVTTRRPRVKLRFRQGYFAVDPYASAHMNENQRAQELGEVMNLDFPASTALTFQAAVIPPSTANRNTVVNFAIDSHKLVFESGDDGKQHAAVECAVRVFDSKDNIVQTRGNTLNAALPPEQYQLVMKKFMPCSQALDLPAGKYLLRLAVRDNTSGLIGSTNASLTIAEASASAAPPADKKN